jgi:hypothetical protein
MCKKVIVLLIIVILLSPISLQAGTGKKKGTANVCSSNNQQGIKHVFVAKKPGKFYGWPANNGVWIWGDEILVGIYECDFIEKDCGHSVGGNGRSILSRSLDGGETWTIEDPDNFAGDGVKAVKCPGGINFTHPDFAMRVNWTEFYISYNRGKTWQGTYKLPDFKLDQSLTARTDYIVNGPSDCMFFLSVHDPKVHAAEKERAFCARTTDGGKTFEFISWMNTDSIQVRSVMPSTVRVSESHLISAMRRRYDLNITETRRMPKCWIDVYESKDNGRTWGFLNKIAETGRSNGNPPSMVRLRDGRLVVTYGVRSVCSKYYYRPEQEGIYARISKDNGQTWGEEIVLRDDPLKWDLGYTRSVQRLDGKIVTMYYFNTRENPEEFIGATIWDPNIGSK